MGPDQKKCCHRNKTPTPLKMDVFAYIVQFFRLASVTSKHIEWSVLNRAIGKPEKFYYQIIFP